MTTARCALFAEASTCLLLYAWSLAWILAFRFQDLPAGNDSCQYLVMAKGIAAGRPFSDLSSPDPHAGGLLGPSFFPFLISLFWNPAGLGLPALKTAIAMAAAAGPVAAFLWLRQNLPLRTAFPAALAFGSSYLFIVQGNSVMTESIFCPLLYTALWLSRRNLDGALGEKPAGARQPGRGLERKDARWGSVAAMVLWAMVARTRVVGWAFFAGYAWLAGRRGLRKTLVPGIMLAGSWVCLERALSREVRVVKYTDGLLTQTFPVLVDPIRGLEALARNLGGNLFAFASAVEGHILAPLVYEAFPMSASKRLFCVAVFLWTAWGVKLTWSARPALRPWLVLLALVNVPTFLIFDSHDSFRYLMPYFPFLVLFFLAPFAFIFQPPLFRTRPSGLPPSETRKRSMFWPRLPEWLPDWFPKRLPDWSRHIPLLAALALAGGQAFASLRHDFESEFIDYPAEFAEIHLAMEALPERPEVCLSGDAYYTYLKTGCPSFQFWGTRHPMSLVRKHSPGKEVWAMCGPRNQYHCDEWKAKGMVFGAPVIRTAHDWMLMRVEAWPEETPATPAADR